VSEAWDPVAWRALAVELLAWQERGRAATIWWRDDDVGRPDPAFERLLGLAGSTAVPLGLAVVPTWLSAEVAAAMRATSAPVITLQHGFAHANHETTAQPGESRVRPAECGAARPAPTVLAEVVDGGMRLRAALGERWLPVFVPPWNRIAPGVLAGLPRAGYRGVSAFGPRPAGRPTPGLLHLNCHVDPIAWRRARRFVGAAAALEGLRAHLADRREGRVDPEEPTGLLTHHRDMSPALWAFLEELFGRVTQHPGVALPPLATLLPTI